MYFLFDRFKIKRPGENFSCPIKTLVIFAHNQDIDIKQDETLKLFNNCKTIEQVEKIQKNNSSIIPQFKNCSMTND